MKLPAIDPLLQNFHKNLVLDPLLKHEADELIEIIEYDNFDEIRIQFLEKIDHTFQKMYHLAMIDGKEYLELDIKNLIIESKFKEIINSTNVLNDIRLINKLFGTNFKYANMRI